MSEQTVPNKTDDEVPGTREETRSLTPPVDIFETENELVVVADVPGARKEEVDVRVDGDVLTLKSRVSFEMAGAAVHNEFTLHEYYRQFQLGEQVDREKITADLKHGVLTLRLPRMEKVKPKQIMVEVKS